MCISAARLSPFCCDSSPFPSASQPNASSNKPPLLHVDGWGLTEPKIKKKAYVTQLPEDGGPHLLLSESPLDGFGSVYLGTKS